MRSVYKILPSGEALYKPMKKAGIPAGKRPCRLPVPGQWFLQSFHEHAQLQFQARYAYRGPGGK
jgi:hypothetical protein